MVVPQGLSSGEGDGAGFVGGVSTAGFAGAGSGTEDREGGVKVGVGSAGDTANGSGVLEFKEGCKSAGFVLGAGVVGQVFAGAGSG